MPYLSRPYVFQLSPLPHTSSAAASLRLISLTGAERSSKPKRKSSADESDDRTVDGFEKRPRIQSMSQNPYYFDPYYPPPHPYSYGPGPSDYHPSPYPPGHHMPPPPVPYDPHRPPYPPYGRPVTHPGPNSSRHYQSAPPAAYHPEQGHHPGYPPSSYYPPPPGSYNRPPPGVPWPQHQYPQTRQSPRHPQSSQLPRVPQSSQAQAPHAPQPAQSSQLDQPPQTSQAPLRIPSPNKLPPMNPNTTNSIPPRPVPSATSSRSDLSQGSQKPSDESGSAVTTPGGTKPTNRMGLGHLVD